MASGLLRVMSYLPVVKQLVHRLHAEPAFQMPLRRLLSGLVPGADSWHCFISITHVGLIG